MNSGPTTHPELSSLWRSIAPAARRGRLLVKSFGATDQGRERTTNEDRFLIAPLSNPYWNDGRGASERGFLFVVADGMGGANAGDTASTMTVELIQDTLVPKLCAVRPDQREHIREELRGALVRADAKLFDESERHPELSGMGTTVTMAYSAGRRLFIAHVGDSRCYLLREGRLRRLTQDHTVVEEMVRRGVLEPERAAHHGLRHMLTNVVGGNGSPPKVELHEAEILAGDVLLLCSDGLTEMVPDAGIAEILRGAQDPSAACEELVDRANQLGGVDNVTAIVAHYVLAP